MDASTINRNFTTQNLNADKLNAISEIKVTAKDLAMKINEICPESREKSIAFTELETAVMWATASIARNSK